MISSEAQRTLVKSPPELWAEISDPESLARHLGEFGEIRITRVQPEQKVEWEGDRASGTVVIKPSGWGTKVKLTVTRELAPDADDAGAPDDADGLGPALAVAPTAPESTPEIGSAGEPEREPRVDSTPQADAAPELAPAREPESVPEPESAPDADATPEPEPAASRVPSSAEADLSAEPEAALAALPASALEPEPESEAEPTERAEPVARRGFFARLFARRRAAAPQLPDAPTPEADRDDQPASIQEEPAGDEPVAQEHIADETPAADLSAEELTAGEPALDEPTAFEPAGFDLQANEPIADAAPSDVSPDLPGREPDGDDRVVPAADEHPADPADESQGGPAGELAAAEKVTAEQVQAVLTGVLDRLGAAHHRPFSRS